MRNLLFLALAMLFLSGCGNAPTSAPSPAGPPQTGAPAQPEGASPMLPTMPESAGRGEPQASPLTPDAIAIQEVDKAGYDAAIAAHQGKVVFVDFWATWCPTCKEKFPHTVEFAKKYAAEDLAVISMSFDDPAEPDAMEEAKRFLAQQGAKFSHLVSTLEVTENFKAYNISGAIPHFKLYDRAGNERYTFEPGPTEDYDPMKMEVLIRELIAEKP